MEAQPGYGLPWTSQQNNNVHMTESALWRTSDQTSFKLRNHLRIDQDTKLNVLPFPVLCSEANMVRCLFSYKCTLSAVFVLHILIVYYL